MIHILWRIFFAFLSEFSLKCSRSSPARVLSSSRGLLTSVGTPSERSQSAEYGRGVPRKSPYSNCYSLRPEKEEVSAWKMAIKRACLSFEPFTCLSKREKQRERREKGKRKAAKEEMRCESSFRAN